MNHKIISNTKLTEALVAAGVLPENCRRYVIDSGEPNGPVKIYWECFGDERLLQVFTAAGIVVAKDE